jgi:hypothetical protein
VSPSRASTTVPSTKIVTGRLASPSDRLNMRVVSVTRPCQ